MPYTTIHWVKLEKRLLNDHKFIALSETGQLMYLKFLMVAAETFNKIPKKTCIIRLLFRTTLTDTEIKKHIKEIKKMFPKFKENKHYFYFEEFETKHNWVSPGSSQIIPKDVQEEDKEEEKNKKKIKRREDINIIIDDLNNIIKSAYKSDTPKTQELIYARFKDGFSIQDFKTVHRKMAKAWGVDNKMRQYLRPQTLYSNKFESYLNRPDDLKISASGAKTYQAGQDWLKDKREKENAK